MRALLLVTLLFCGCAAGTIGTELESCGPADCDDSDPCTSDSCSAEGGCVHEPVLFCSAADEPYRDLPDGEPSAWLLMASSSAPKPPMPLWPTSPGIPTSRPNIPPRPGPDPNPIFGAHR